MEKKTAHRILGLFVVVGIIIILLPFLQSGKEMSTETTVIKAPPFPDQALQTTTTSGASTTQPEPEKEEIALPKATQAANPSAASSSQNPENKIDQSTTSSQLTVPKNTQSTAQSIQTAAPTQALDTFSTEKTKPTLSKPIHSKKIIQKEKPHKKSIVSSKEIDHLLLLESKQNKKMQSQQFYPAIKTTTLQSIDKNGLIKLKNAAWVVQIGSFKNKANALRLVNHLRSKGYRAFIQQVASVEDNTRVYVGPEFKQASARALANQLEEELHLHGIVISYQPLTL